MTMDENPFASPAEPAKLQAATGPSDMQGLWRDGNLLVMHKQARLPNLCVKSGVVTNEEGIRRNLQWHPPWIAITILAGLLIYVILALVLTKRATITMPLSEDEKQKRRSWLAVNWIIGLGSLALVIGCIGGFTVINRPSDEMSIALMLGIVAGIIGMLVALVIGQTVARILKPTKITETHLWLKGVHESILSQLPAVPPT